MPRSSQRKLWAKWPYERRYWSHRRCSDCFSFCPHRCYPHRGNSVWNYDHQTVLMTCYERNQCFLYRLLWDKIFRTLWEWKATAAQSRDALEKGKTWEEVQIFLKLIADALLQWVLGSQRRICQLLESSVHTSIVSITFSTLQCSFITLLRRPVYWSIKITNLEECTRHGSQQR